MPPLQEEEHDGPKYIQRKQAKPAVGHVYQKRTENNLYYIKPQLWYMRKTINSKHAMDSNDFNNLSRGSSNYHLCQIVIKSGLYIWTSRFAKFSL